MKLKIAYLLLHDQRFSGWRLSDFVFSRYHFAKDYAERMGSRGNEVVLFTFHQGVREVKEFALNSYTLKVFPVSFRFPPLIPIGNSHNFEVFKELEEESFDIVHFHNYYLWSLAPIIFFKRGGHFRMVGQYHGEPELQVIGKHFHRFLFHPIDKFLVSTNEEIYWLKKLHVDSSKIVKFPNVGVDIHQYYKICQKEELPHLIYVGRMTLQPRTLKEKNPWIILEVASKLKKRFSSNFKLLMVGDGPGLEALKNFSKRLGLRENVKFLGYIPHHLLPSLYSKCLLAFVPISMGDIDPFWDGSLKEALACETAVAGFNMYVRNYAQARKRFGLLLPVDIDKAAEILSIALSEKNFLFEAGSRGRKFVEKYCSWDKLIGKLIRLYNNLVNSPSNC